MAKKSASLQARATKPWTVMIYMIADDPAGGALLDQQANRELDQIIHATLSVNSEQLYVAVQVDFRSQPDVWRRVVGEGAWLQPESNAADPETLYGFFEWASRMCPADRYMLILWGHSRGPFGLFTDAPFSSALSGLFAQAGSVDVRRADADTERAAHRAASRARVSQSGSGHHRVQRLLHEHARDGVRAEGCRDVSHRVTGHRADRGLAVRTHVRAAHPAARREAGGEGRGEGAAAALPGRGQPSRAHSRCRSRCSRRASCPT